MDSGTWPWSAEELRECDDDDDDDDDEGKSSPAQAIGWSSSWISGGDEGLDTHRIWRLLLLCCGWEEHIGAHRNIFGGDGRSRFYGRKLNRLLPTCFILHLLLQFTDGN